MKSKGWHSRGYIPHFDGSGVMQALTFRLNDSLPKHIIQRWQKEVTNLTDKEAHLKLRIKIAEYEDSGHGECILQNPTYANLVQNALLHFDAERYRLLEWVIMPNHVHALIETQSEPLDRIIKSWKTFTARQINLLRKTTSPVWARDYHDRYIRDLDHYHNAKAYIRNNPVKAKLCAKPEDWPYSSAQPGTAGL